MPTRLGVALTAAWLCACASHDDYWAYKQAHPGWEADFPKLRYSLPELLAVIHAPAGRNTVVVVTHLRVLALGSEPWQDVPLAKIRDGSFVPDPNRPYVVAARAECMWSSMHYAREGYERRETRSFVWYVLRDERLLAYDHTGFLERCNTWDALKGELRDLPGFEGKLDELLEESPTS